MQVSQLFYYIFRSGTAGLYLITGLYLLPYLKFNCRNDTTAICSTNYKANQSSEIAKNSNFVQLHPTTCYIHGFRETQNDSTIKTVVESYVLHYKKSNLISVDWSYLASKDYAVASSNVPAVRLNSLLKF